MFSKVLIGTDGLSGGRDALALARDLAAPGAKLVLGHVWQTGAGVTAAVAGLPHPAVVGRELVQDEVLAADIDCTTAVRSATSTAAGLHELAQENGCDLLVVGSPERGVSGHATLSRPHRTALHAAPCAVAVAPSGYAVAGRAIARVGVGYEETAIGDAALATARGIAAKTGAELDVMLVLAPLPGPWTSAPSAYLAELDDLFENRARKAQARLDALQGCRGFVRRGDAATRLREFSATVSLLVLGSRGYGPARRLLLGSTSDAVVEDCAGAVLVLTKPSEDGPKAAAPRSPSATADPPRAHAASAGTPA